MIWRMPDPLLQSNAELKTLLSRKHIAALKTWETNKLHSGRFITNISATKLNITLAFSYHNIFPIYLLCIIIL